MSYPRRVTEGSSWFLAHANGVNGMTLQTLRSLTVSISSAPHSSITEGSEGIQLCSCARARARGISLRTLRTPPWCASRARTKWRTATARRPALPRLHPAARAAVEPGAKDHRPETADGQTEEYPR